MKWSKRAEGRWPSQLDVRDEQAIQAAVEQAAQHFGSIDVLVNNASAISMHPYTGDDPEAARLDVGSEYARDFSDVAGLYPLSQTGG